MPELIRELPYYLNQLNGTTGLDAAKAANQLAGSTGLELVGALNKLAGSTGLELDGVLNKLAGTTGLGACLAASKISLGNPVVALGTGNNLVANNNAAGTTLSLNVPSNKAVGDLLVAVVATQNTTASTTWTATGWTELCKTNSTRAAAIFCKPIPDASALSGLSASYNFTMTGTSVRMAGVMFRVTGADLVNPGLGSSSMVTGSTTSTTQGSFTTAAAGLVIGFLDVNAGAGNGSYITSTTPAPFAASYAGAFGSSNTGVLVYADTVTNETVHPDVTIGTSPAAAAAVIGMRTAIKKA